MNLFKKIICFLKPFEPPFEKTEFEKFEDALLNFQIFYPKHWSYEKETAVIDGAYAIIFHSTTSPASLRIEVNTKIPKCYSKKDFRKYAKNEIEKPTAGVIANAKEQRINNYECIQTEYFFYDRGRKFYGKKIFIFVKDRIFSLFFICDEENHKNLKKTFDYIVDSLVIKPKKLIIV
ncbi:MAG: hypothetical protein QXX68_03270 [Candidatus Pacearchaeota archaeon]